MTDIRLDNDEGHFKFRVAGILEHNKKYLAVKIADNTFYCLPGGHVELGESTDEAVLREMNEELGFPVKIKKFVGIAQNFYGKANKQFHEISCYYIVEAENENNVRAEDYTVVENDKGVLKNLAFKWLTKEEIKSAEFKPKFVSDMLSSEKTLSVVNRDESKCEIKEL